MLLPSLLYYIKSHCTSLGWALLYCILLFCSPLQCSQIYSTPFYWRPLPNSIYCSSNLSLNLLPSVYCTPWHSTLPCTRLSCMTDALFHCHTNSAQKTGWRLSLLWKHICAQCAPRLCALKGQLLQKGAGVMGKMHLSIILTPWYPRCLFLSSKSPTHDSIVASKKTLWTHWPDC